MEFHSLKQIGETSSKWKNNETKFIHHGSEKYSREPYGVIHGIVDSGM
jgi:hypothetical protein